MFTMLTENYSIHDFQRKRNLHNAKLIRSETANILHFRRLSYCIVPKHLYVVNRIKYECFILNFFSFFSTPGNNYANTARELP